MKTILVVEDEAPLLDAIKKKLESNGFSVVTSRTVKQAMDYVESIQRIDAVWLDHYLLGRENGLDFLAALKNLGGKYRDIPVFVVSNTAGPDKVQSYIKLGADRYFVKADHRLDEIINEIKASFIGQK